MEHIHVEQSLQLNASLRAKVQAVREQQQLELEAFELQNQELPERMNLERQRIKLQIELVRCRRQANLEMMQLTAELAQLKTNSEAEEDTPTVAAPKVAKVDLPFTQSTPNASASNELKPNVPTPKGNLQTPL